MQANFTNNYQIPDELYERLVGLALNESDPFCGCVKFFVSAS